MDSMKLNCAGGGDPIARNLSASSLKTDRMDWRYFRALTSAAPLKRERDRCNAAAGSISALSGARPH